MVVGGRLPGCRGVGECRVSIAVLFFLYILLPKFTRRAGVLALLRADSARDHVRPVSVRTTSGCTKVNKFMHHTAVLSRFHGSGPGMLIFSYKSFSRNAPCCGLFGNRMRMRVLGLVGCSTTAVNGRRFSFKLRGVTHLFGVTSFPVMYTGCNIRKAILRKLMGPCIVLRHSNLGVNMFNLNTGVRKLIRTSGCRKMAFRSPITMTGRVTTGLGRMRKYSTIIYLSRVKVGRSRVLIRRAHGVSIMLNKRSRAFVRRPTFFIGLSKRDMPMSRANGGNVFIKGVSLAFRE